MHHTPIYADYAATTPVDEQVLQAMLPYFTRMYGNASSTHAAGLDAQQAVMQARMRIAGHIGARMSEIVFTSGATEAINLAIIGAARASLDDASCARRHIVTLASEHAAVLDACRECERLGFDVTFLGVDADGLVSASELADAVRDTTLLVSVMAVNNETGVVQDLALLGEIARAHGALFMTDATQAYGKMPLDVDAMGIDLMTFSGHKIYGPKGVGALFVRNRPDKACALQPLQVGGGQERGIRSGTLNVPGIVGLAEAGQMALAHLEQEDGRIRAFRQEFEDAIVAHTGATVNGHRERRNAGTSNITFNDINVDILLADLPHIACSKGSACSSSKPKPSHVLTAMGRSADEANRTLRFSFGRYTTDEEIRRLIADVCSAHENLRASVTQQL